MEGCEIFDGDAYCSVCISYFLYQGERYMIDQITKSFLSNDV